MKGQGMATTTTTTAASTGTARGGLLTGGIAAFVFVVLFVIGFVMASDTPDGDASNREWRNYFLDSGNQRMIVLGVIMLTLAAIAFLIFLGVLREVASQRGGRIRLDRDRDLRQWRRDGRHARRVRARTGICGSQRRLRRRSRTTRRRHHAHLRECRLRRHPPLRRDDRRTVGVHDVDPERSGGADPALARRERLRRRRESCSSAGCCSSRSFCSYCGCSQSAS